MSTKEIKIPKSGWAILYLGLGAGLASACGDPFSSCDARRSCSTTGGTAGEAGSIGANEAGGQGGEANVSGRAGDRAAAGAAGAANGGESNAPDPGTGGGIGSVSSGGADIGETGTGGTSGGTRSAEGGTAAGADGGGEGGESTGGAGGNAGNGEEAGAGGAAVNPCDPNPCTHSATCVPSGSTSTCKCAEGYTGEHCELPVFEGIGVIDGTSFAYSVSGDGKTLIGESGVGDAIVWTSETGIQPLEKLTGYSFCSAWGISADGNVAVGAAGRSASAGRLVRIPRAWAHAIARLTGPTRTEA